MATSSGWDSYIWKIQNKWSNKQQKYLVTNVCQHAAIYGIDGSPWVTSSDWPGLHSYVHPLEQDDGSTVNVDVNEFVNCMKVTDGNRMPNAAGVRMGNTKFVFVRHDPEEKVVSLTKVNGGACVVKTKNAIVIGMWDKNIVMSNNQPQTMGLCNEAVELVAKSLKELGY